MNHHTSTAVLVAAALTVLSACGSDKKSASLDTVSGTGTPPAAGTPAAGTGAPPATGGAFGGKAVQLGGDPCALLTVPEIEAALGAGVEQGGFGADLAGRCTYSVGGDVGAGVVQIILQVPLECDAVMRALASDSLEGIGAVPVDLGDGGLFTGTQVVFMTGGGCVAVGGSKAGVNLGREMLVALATEVAARVG